MEQPARGRPRKYCSRACRQRAYESRNNIGDPNIPTTLSISPSKASRLHDYLYELRCAAEDVDTAAREEASAAEMRQLTGELVALARKIEHLR